MDIGTKIGRGLDRVGLWTIPIAIMICATVGFGVLYGGDWMLRRSDAYVFAMRTLQSSEQARELIGEPIEHAGFASGTVKVQTGGKGLAVLRIPVEGPAGSGLLHVNALRDDSVWGLSALVLQRFDPEQAIDLLKESEAAPAIRLRRARNEIPNSR